MNQKEWLPHIAPEIAIENRFHICAYLVALEGWRRGLTLTWYSQKVKKNRVHAPGRYFSLSSDEQTHYFYKSKGDLTSPKAQGITGKKHITKEWLSKAGVSIPQGNAFTGQHADEDIVAYANELTYPVVLKPTNGFQGIGVFANLKNEEEFRGALKHLREEMGFKDVIVEQFIDGKEYRIFVIGGEVIGAIEKIPPMVIGDGQRTVRQLIRDKNKDKKKNPHLVRKPIKIDYEVESIVKAAGYTLDSVLEEGKNLQVRDKNSLSSGGDPVDATDLLSKQAKENSVKALEAIPDLSLGGLDVMIDRHTQEAYVIEINAIPMIGSHLFPEIGIARDVPSAIIDHYFPETKDKREQNRNMYFNLADALKPLQDKISSEVTIQPAPVLEKAYATKYIVEGKVQKVGYRKWIRRRAIECDLCGYTKNLTNGTVEVVVTGEEKDVKAFIDVCKQGPKRAEVTNVVETPWGGPFRIGFTIEETPTKKKKAKAAPKKPTQPKPTPTFLGKVKRAIKRKLK